MSQRVVLFLGVILAFGAGCKNKKDYQTWKAEELGSGRRNDALFLNLHFGMQRKAFYDTCFTLNRTGVITNGPTNTTALQVLPPIKGRTMDFNFYPRFCQNTICAMDITFSDHEWSQWAPKTFAEEVLPLAVDWLSDHFHTSFEKLKIDDKRTRLVSIDGNREILVWLKDQQHVAVLITDLTATPDKVQIDPNAKPDALWQKITPE